MRATSHGLPMCGVESSQVIDNGAPVYCRLEPDHDYEFHAAPFGAKTVEWAARPANSPFEQAEVVGIVNRTLQIEGPGATATGYAAAIIEALRETYPDAFDVAVGDPCPVCGVECDPDGRS